MSISTMTRIPAESRLPSGTTDDDMRLPFPNLGSESSSSVISPLTLPRGTVGYFDLSSSTTSNSTSQPTSALRLSSKMAAAGNANFRSSQVYSPLSPAARGPALPQPPQFLSPHLSPITREVQYQLQQQRSTSLPPSHRGTSPTTTRSQNNMSASSLGVLANGTPSISNSPLPSISSVSAGSHPRSISADSASAPSHAQMIRRLVQQNARIREAWEAERKYMEANRERAEEVYKEERALMEEERIEWEDEKASLLQAIERLQQQVLGLGGDPRLPGDGGFTHPNAAFGPGQGIRGGGGSQTSPESARSSHSSQGTSHRPQRPQTAQTSPPNNPSSASLRPNGAVVSPSDFLPTAEADAGPVPTVDIQEIHPELEGIPIKATSVSKSTFTDGSSQKGSNSSSRASSPSTSTGRPSMSSKEASKEQTLQVLAAPEFDRLTMHAGHTPSHSLSQLPTISTATTTASSSGDSTPTMSQADGTSSHGLAPITEVDSTTDLSEYAVEPGPSMSSNQAPPSEDHPMPNLEPAEDAELKGPLMVRNMPVHDEIFFRRLSDKLEEVSKDTKAALPAVLKNSPELAEQLEEKPEAPAAAPEEPPATVDSGSEKEGSPKSSDEEELDIPLKIKRSFNFGAPFGEFR
ncbi:hypothetical protein B0H66DRAFT_510768 [Apodospora peruviana]|uniref:Uncharacterized protein n=1 Tax=Apodospora peruviana TaxID=516989 RepID=A0AAE0ITR1_9PEZI|nr:hypothetical protein B0H66DRAFT_510768 [Apodospora peruviana]